MFFVRNEFLFLVRNEPVGNNSLLLQDEHSHVLIPF